MLAEFRGVISHMPVLGPPARRRSLPARMGSSFSHCHFRIDDSRLPRFGFREAPRPRTPENYGASLHASQSSVLVIALEEENQVLCRKNVVDLTADPMHRVKRNKPRGQ